MSVWDNVNKAASRDLMPIAANCVGSIRTPQGVEQDFTKPNGRLITLVDRDAIERIRQRKADKFRAMVEANAETEEFFNQVFSEDEVDTIPFSLVRTKSSKRGQEHERAEKH